MTNRIEDETPNDATGRVALSAGKLVGGGRAIAHHNGETWMVSGALPGERVDAILLKRRAGILEGTVVEVLGSPHPARLNDPCPHAPVCGGCDWPHVDPVAGTKLKQQAAAEAARSAPDLARRIGSAPVHGSPLQYRLRARLHWDPGARNLGFFGFRSHDVSPVSHCRILSPTLMSVIPEIAESLARRSARALDVEWLEGSDPAWGIAALRNPPKDRRRLPQRWLPQPDELPPAVRGFHLLDRHGVASQGWGEREVRIDLPIPLTVPVGAFFQGNRHLVGGLFSRVSELVGAGTEATFDLHAGVGFLAAAARSKGERPLLLVEPHRGAAEAAARNLPGARVLGGSTAEEFLEGMESLPQDALVITDPPRSGLSPTVRQALTRQRPQRILMLGCAPDTWARDARELTEHGYSVVALELFDLFPSTHHIEILALLERG